MGDELTDEVIARTIGDDSAASFFTTRPTFTGHGGEYFRIWTVNLLFTLLTCGLYSAWAKVRKATYFRNNTSLGGHVFHYHASPVAILRGRILAVILLAAYSWAFNFSKTAGLVTIVILCAVGPWLFMRAQQFALSNTSFRGLRFGFRARTQDAYVAILPVLGLWLAPTAVGALASPTWLMAVPPLVVTAAFPWMHHRAKVFQRGHATYGDRDFTFTSATGRFYAVYAKGLGLMFLASLVIAAAALGVFVWRRTSGVTLGPGIESAIYGAVGGLIAYLVIVPYYSARLQQIVWDRTELGDIRFRTEIKAARLFTLVLKNVTLTVLTAGLYWPWASVALARYRIECVHVESGVPLSTLAAGVQASAVTAAGEGAVEAFGFDIGL